MIGYGQGGTVTPNIPFGSKSMITQPNSFPWATAALAGINMAQIPWQNRKIRQQRAAQERLKQLNIGDVVRNLGEARADTREEMASRGIAGSPTQRAAQSRLKQIAEEQLYRIREQDAAEKRGRSTGFERFLEGGLPLALALL